MDLFWKPDQPYGFLSQWYTSPFEIDGVEFRCAEQYMMYAKAILFGDTDIANEILLAKTPRTMKALGRKVKGFKEDLWVANRMKIVTTGNFAKFSQNPKLKSLLLETGDDILVEASPYDKIYGIGFGAGHKYARIPSKWRGKNLLGKALMNIRAKLNEITSESTN